MAILKKRVIHKVLWSAGCWTYRYCHWRSFHPTSVCAKTAFSSFHLCTLHMLALVHTTLWGKTHFIVIVVCDFVRATSTNQSVIIFHTAFSPVREDHIFDPIWRKQCTI